MLLRQRAAERRAVEERTAAAFGPPLLAAAEVVDEPERDVVHRVAVGDGEREREERDPALGVDRPVDRVDDDPRSPPSPNARPELLRDEREVALVERVEPLTTASSAAASIAVVSSPPSPARSTGSRSSRVGQPSSTSLMSVEAPRGRARASRSSAVDRVEEEAGDELREEVRRFLWHRLAARAPARRRPRRAVGRRRKAASASPRVDAGDGLLASRACSHGLVRRRARRARRRAGRGRRGRSTPLPRCTTIAAARRRRARAAVVRLVDRTGARVDGSGDLGARRADAWGRSRGPGSSAETSTASIARSGVPGSGVERERGLVAVVAVGDQELPARRTRRHVVCVVDAARDACPRPSISGAPVGAATGGVPS